jgi:hypothetical protein
MFRPNIKVHGFYDRKESVSTMAAGLPIDQTINQISGILLALQVLSAYADNLSKKIGSDDSLQKPSKNQTARVDEGRVHTWLASAVSRLTASMLIKKEELAELRAQVDQSKNRIISSNAIIQPCSSLRQANKARRDVIQAAKAGSDLFSKPSSGG